MTRCHLASFHPPSRGLRTLLAALVVLPALAGCQRETDEEIETVAAVHVQTAVAHLGTIRNVVAVSGTVTPAPGGELLVVAPQPGRVAYLPKGLGETVRRGEVVARFELPALAGDLAARQADLDRAKARQASAVAAGARLRDLFARGIAAHREVEAAERELAEAAADVAGAGTARATAASLAAQVEVRAPFDGVVVGRWHQPGDTVEAAAGDPVLRLLDLRRLEVQAAVPAALVPAVATGAEARVFVPGRDGSLAATVLTRPAMLDPTTATALARLSLAATSDLAAGLAVRVEILGAPRPGALLVPASAVVEEGAQQSVFVLDTAGRARRRAVRVGVVAGGEAEILSGLEAGATVVSAGLGGLPDGALTAPS